MKTFLRVLLAASVLVLLAAAPASAQLRIVAPTTAEAAQPVRFAATAPPTAEAVSFHVDGRQRFVDRTPSWKFGRSGYIKLPAGRHRLKVRARQNGAVAITTKSLYVRPSPTGTAAGTERPGAARPAKRSSVPAPTPPAKAAAGHDDPGLLFLGNSLDDFSNQSAPGAVSEVPDPAGSGAAVFKLRVEDDDVYPLTPTENPRAQLCSEEFIDDGEEFWWHARFYLPADFPARVPSWLNVLEGPYGRPWAGPPPLSIKIDGDEMRWQRNETYDWDIPWAAPVVRGAWTDVLIHARFASEGFVEMWINGEQVTFFANDVHNPNEEAETGRLEMATLDDSNSGGHGAVILQNYRKMNIFDEVSLYHGATAVGTTRASVAG